MNRTALYRHFDADGNLLYVGISLSAIGRLCTHMHSSPWRYAVARVEVEWFSSRNAALSAETSAIKTEKPKYNVAGNPVALDARRKERQAQRAWLQSKLRTLPDIVAKYYPGFELDLASSIKGETLVEAIARVRRAA